MYISSDTLSLSPPSSSRSLKSISTWWRPEIVIIMKNNIVAAMPFLTPLMRLSLSSHLFEWKLKIENSYFGISNALFSLISRVHALHLPQKFLILTYALALDINYKFRNKNISHSLPINQHLFVYAALGYLLHSTMSHGCVCVYLCKQFKNLCLNFSFLLFEKKRQNL